MAINENICNVKSEKSQLSPMNRAMLMSRTSNVL